MLVLPQNHISLHTDTDVFTTVEPHSYHAQVKKITIPPEDLIDDTNASLADHYIKTHRDPPNSGYELNISTAEPEPQSPPLQHTDFPPSPPEDLEQIRASVDRWEAKYAHLLPPVIQRPPYSEGHIICMMPPGPFLEDDNHTTPSWLSGSDDEPPDFQQQAGSHPSKPTEWDEGHLPDSRWESNDLSDPFDDQEALPLPSSPYDEPNEENDGVVYDYELYPDSLPDLNPVLDSEDKDEDEPVCSGTKCGEVELIIDDWSSAGSSPSEQHLLFPLDTSVPPVPQIPSTPNLSNLTLDNEQPKEAEECPFSPRTLLLQAHLPYIPLGSSQSLSLSESSWSDWSDDPYRPENIATIPSIESTPSSPHPPVILWARTEQGTGYAYPQSMLTPDDLQFHVWSTPVVYMTTISRNDEIIPSSEQDEEEEVEEGEIRETQPSVTLRSTSAPPSSQHTHQPEDNANEPVVEEPTTPTPSRPYPDPMDEDSDEDNYEVMMPHDRHLFSLLLSATNARLDS
ncbi:hypothetical protein JAAARDRAFT_200890 [Jaapia argillacea MUCL 33604]|uniref:Uncharacterized protein n=1 Tax=Jaapia argillacea MUCL 33604 TaxID=933084 RepID=A0A067P3S5_9AGAM|nr:hypothetical protein JAAARDRAFT_200890 [Jaapia argillacea MUCL 33604]